VKDVLRCLWRAAAVAFLLAVGIVACSRPAACEAKNRVRLDFSVKDLNGKDVNLGAYRGRPLLVNFWATWCGPCKEEIPALVALNAQYSRKRSVLDAVGLGPAKPVILGISVDDRPEDLQKFAATNKINYPLLVGLGHDDLLEAYDAQVVVPVTWIVASNGCVVQKHQGGATKDWFEQQMKALL
jgi:thiol-disulfide isomerase/thioredoxin